MNIFVFALRLVNVGVTIKLRGYTSGMKTLAELVGCLLHARLGPPRSTVTGISYHSAVSVQVICSSVYRNTFTRQALCTRGFGCGAAAVVTDADDVAAEQATVITVPDTRLALALLAACYYDYPATELVLTGVTGTNGKTTTTHLIDALLRNTVP